MAGSGNSGVKLRIVSALVLIPLALAAAWFGWPWLPALVAAAAAGMGFEWARLVDGGLEQRRALIVATPLAAAVLAAFLYPAAACAVAVMGAAAVGAQAVGREAPAPLWTAGGTLWLALGCVAFLWIAALAGRATVLWLLVLVWSVDVAAYAVGSVVGGPKLAPVLSPKKTWAGFVGGLVGAAIAGAAAAALTGAAIVVVVLASVGIGLAAQLGDLAESAAKRRFNVKDTGGLIPGHGGLLDRLDSLLAAALAVAILVLVTGAAPLQWQAL